MSDTYKTVVGIAESAFVVKKSRFFGTAAAVESQEAAKAFLDRVKEMHPRASHYCYAYCIGSGGEPREYSTDAGEPTHTAGPPILSAIRASDLSNVICVVTRYYGGVNLGKGGLIRAYGRCARECLHNATIEDRILYDRISLKVDYPDIGRVVALCKRVGGRVIEIQYDPAPVIQVQIRQQARHPFQAQLQGLGILPV